jgi:uncharacterized protein YjlB
MEPDIKTFVLEPEGDIPNSSLPLILYRYALPPTLRSRSGCQSLFARNQWSGNWVDGIFDYWHFHVTGHEVLGCVAGSALVGFGGDGGVQVEFRAGDVVVIPAGVGHKRLSEKHDGFHVVGLSAGAERGESRGRARFPSRMLGRAIASLQPPRADPVQGEQGVLLAAWNITTAPVGDGRSDVGGPTDPSR